MQVSVVRKGKQEVGPKYQRGQDHSVRFVDCPAVVGVDIAQELSMLQVKCHGEQMAPPKQQILVRRHDTWTLASACWREGDANLFLGWREVT